MNDETLLHRQVAPSWVQQGRITSQVFKPTAKDAGRISVYDGDQIEADASWDHYTQTLHFDSIGVVGVSVLECTEEDLRVRSDPKPFPEHAAIDFTDHAGNQAEKKSKKLKRKAEKRGWTYQP